MVLGFLITILIGTGLLLLPTATLGGKELSFLEALFMATSAVCVTGLVVVDTGTTFTVFGKFVILFLIQIGGLGFMTFATFFAVLTGKKIYLRERLILQEALNQISVQGVVRLVRYIAAITLIVEGLGAVLLALRFAQDLPLSKAALFGLFHAVSAFNNAGFDLFGDFQSLTGFTGDLYVNVILMILIVAGGLGFAVIAELLNRKHFCLCSLHSRLVLVTTGILLGAGTIMIFVLEFGHSLAELDWGTKILAALFQSVTARTAGFNTIDIVGLTSASQLLIIMLMFIGASPGSTGGGIKTTTFAAVVLAVKGIISGKEDTTVFSRRLAPGLIKKALAIFFISSTLVITSTLILLITEQADFLTTLFEATSAFATVGLSMGLTTELTSLGKMVIILTMFMGRLGPLTIAMALGNLQTKKVQIRYPEDKVNVG